MTAHVGVNHGISESLINAIFDVSNLIEEVKMGYETKHVLDPVWHELQCFQKANQSFSGPEERLPQDRRPTCFCNADMLYPVLIKL